jgi:hypothetical protein
MQRVTLSIDDDLLAEIICSGGQEGLPKSF